MLQRPVGHVKKLFHVTNLRGEDIQDFYVCNPSYLPNKDIFLLTDLLYFQLEEFIPGDLNAIKKILLN